jgi:hypothetical protein
MPDLSEKELDALVEEATVDAYGDDEQLGGFAVMIEENLEMPFQTTVLGVQVTVTGVTQTESGIDDLIAVAAKASAPLVAVSDDWFADWVTALPASEKDKFLTMAAEGEGAQVEAMLVRRFRYRCSLPATRRSPRRSLGSRG